MATKLPTSWQQKARDAIRNDPKRAGVLGVLLVVLAVVGGRTLMGAKTPLIASAATPAAKSKTDNHAKDVRPTARRDAAAMRKWLAVPVRKLDRNLFAAKIENYPQLSGKKSKNTLQPGKELTAEEKLAQQSADVLKERHTLTEAMHLDARRLVLTSTVTGAVPKALINGEMVKEGDVVASGSESPEGEPSAGFRVLKIEARRVIIEREGIKLEILMK